MEQVLLLNATFEPLKVIDWKRAIRLLTLGKVEVVEEYDREIRAVTFAIKLPSVLRLLQFVRYRKKDVKFSRVNIYARDGFQCQYCGKKFESEDLTFDHVIPKRYGGKTEWTNIVTCCYKCNRVKGGRSLKEAGFKLLKKPVKPGWVPFIMITIGVRRVPDSWRDYLYWHVELESG
ncbi:MAG: HNH endonuclease [Deltaproteobacteria bacterium]|nr:HNH endonuclease [Deltaproteobacteria bacterium]MBW2018875.1 HNH endonuclease [Deltaproteobacteria bacterium]MBW2073630.1 HNH endonuclease [Deltaproteobacteria bacterium]RLB81940.1 MAG: HNH endonuclease [Deltaproteobacteria bacterium]